MPQTSGHTRQFGSCEMTMTPSTLVQKPYGWLPTSLTSRALCSPSQICNVLSRFIIYSDPFAKQTQLPCPSHETGLVWEQSLNCTRTEWGAVLKARQDTTALFTFWGERKEIQKECVMAQKQALQTNSTMNVFHFDHPFQPVTKLRQYFVLQKLVPSRPAVDLLFLLELALPF